MTLIAERLLEIRSSIDAALARSLSPEREVVVIAVTKGHPAGVVMEAARAGLVDIGENRVQEALSKAQEVEEAVRWHLIGHLQRNKATRAAGFFAAIHSVDSVRLVEALARTGIAAEIFLQINVSGEQSKFGADPSQARDLWQTALRADGLDVVGLMTMAPYDPDPETARTVFRALRELRDELNRLGDGPPLTALSMGMSGDYEVAIEEGATHVRIGTALVGQKGSAGG